MMSSRRCSARSFSFFRHWRLCPCSLNAGATALMWAADDIEKIRVLLAAGS